MWIDDLHSLHLSCFTLSWQLHTQSLSAHVLLYATGVDNNRSMLALADASAQFQGACLKVIQTA